MRENLKTNNLWVFAMLIDIDKEMHTRRDLVLIITILESF